MNYDNFEAAFVKENRKLKLVLGLVILLMGLALAAIVTQQRFYLYRGAEIFEERPLAVEVCRLGFISLAEGEPHRYVVSKEIIDLVKKEPFSLNVEKILQLVSTMENQCKIILKADGKLIAFKITLQGSNSHPFFYQLSQLDELAVEKESL